MDIQERIDRALVVAAIVVVLLLFVSRGLKADDLSERVAIAIAIENANPWYPPKPPPVPPNGPKITVRIPSDDRHCLFFTQHGCPPCARSEAEFPKLEEEGLTVRDLGTISHVSRIDINVHPELAAKYGVTQTPTFVMIQGGKRLGTKVGYQSAETLFTWWFDAKASQTLVPRPTMQSSGGHWSHPGPIASHLRNDHGVNPSGLTHEQMLNLHDSLHEAGSRKRKR